MSVITQWFKSGPRTEIHVDITSGSLTLTSASKLLNYADYGWNPDDVTGAIYKNGSSAATLGINSSTGAITSSAVSVAQGDVVEVRLEFTGKFSWPFHNKMVARRSAFLVVPAGNATFDFDDGNNKQPVPGFELGFGWDSANKLKVGFKVASADGASQSLAAYSRRLPAAQESSSTISLISPARSARSASMKRPVRIISDAKLAPTRRGRK